MGAAGSAGSAGGAKIGALATLVLGVGAVAGVVGGAAVLYGPGLIEKYRAKAAEEVVAPAPEVEVAEVKEEESRKGFEMGTLAPEEPVRTIAVTVTVGDRSAEGAGPGALQGKPGGGDLAEPVDLYLGTGFPFRLYPLGSDTRDPAFAAFPQKASLARGENRIAAGESATFEFAVGGERGQDALNTTPQLLADLTVGDLVGIGFASRGESDWILAGYRIEVNGQLFAANDDVSTGPAGAVREVQAELQMKMPGFEALAKEVADLETYVETGLASDADRSSLAAKRAELEQAMGPLSGLLGEATGYHPWYMEENEGFTPAKSAGGGVKSVKVTLATGGGERPGSRNPVYLSAGGKKFLLSSEADPLLDDPAPQVFVLGESDLATGPMTLEDLKTVGIGMVGNEERFAAVPDRARLQRVVVEADGTEIFNSETSNEDRRTLAGVWLQPPAHFDGGGSVVDNPVTAAEVYLWKKGMVLPEEAVAPDDNENEPGPLKVTTGSTAPSPLRITGTGAPIGTPLRRTGPFGTGGLGQRRVNPFVSTLANALRAIAAPGPRGVTISGIRIAPVVPIVQVGDVAIVNFTVTGVTTGVSAYRVDLMPVLPHLPGSPGPRGIVGPPLATFTAPPPVVGGTGTITSPPIGPISQPAVGAGTAGNSASFFPAGLPVVALPGVTNPAQLTQLYVQPRVTALGANGLPINGAGTFGSVLPLFPFGTAAPAGAPPGTPGAFGTFFLNRGLAVPPTNPMFPVPPGGAVPIPLAALLPDGGSAGAIGVPNFQVFNPGPAAGPTTNNFLALPLPRPIVAGSAATFPRNTGAFFSSFQAMAPVTNPGPGGSGAFGLTTEPSAQGLSFATNEFTFNSTAAPFSTNTGARTSGTPGNTVALIYEGVVQYPQAGTPGTPGTIRGYRIVGHVGYLDGAPALPAAQGPAQVGVTVELSAGSSIVAAFGGAAPFPMVLDLDRTNVDQAVYGGASGAPYGAFFTYTNATPINFSKAGTGSPLMLIDVPIDFGLMDGAAATATAAGGGGAFPTPYPTPAPVGFDGGPNPFANTAVTPNPFGNGPLIGAPVLIPPGTGAPVATNPVLAGNPNFSFSDITVYNGEKAAGGVMTLRVTILIDTTRLPAETIGLFGLRIVPDTS